MLGFDVRGFGRSRAAVPDPSPHGWIATGLESPGTNVLRGAVCDYVRAVEVGRLLLIGRPVTRIGAPRLRGWAGGAAVEVTVIGSVVRTFAKVPVCRVERIRPSGRRR